jgi:serine/threonine-protein kinase
MIGAKLGNYRIVDRLGAGGMGEVYCAEDEKLGRKVALKVMAPELTSDPELLRRFETEARALAALNHPNIVTVHSLEESNDRRFITMEFVAGRPLSEIGGRVPMAIEKAVDIGVQICEALSAAHDRSIVHRDLKPANVMVTPEGQVKVLDFGIAKLRSFRTDGDSEAPTALETKKGTTVGTLQYMSPEQVEAREIDHRSDLFSLGVILYEMVTGRRPFVGRGPASLASAILHDVPSPMDEVPRDLASELGPIVERCLAKKPENRYQSAGEIAEMLSKLRANIQTGMSSGAKDAVVRRSPRRGWLWGAFFATAVFVAITVAYRSGIFMRSGVGSDSGSRHIRSLVVLPFDNLTNDPEQDSFVGGMHEALITDLSRIDSLRVISRTSAVRYREGEKSLPEIARELDVEGVIEGSVLRSGDRVRITAQLIDGTNDSHVWAESYDRDLSDVLMVLSDVARSIAAEVELVLTPEQDRALTRSSASNPELTEAYLLARHHWSRLEFSKALHLYEKCVALDPDFAAGHAGIAASYWANGFFGEADIREAREEAEKAAQRALEYDPEQAEAFGVIGFNRLYFDWDWNAAEAAFKRSLSLNPGNPYVRHGLADYYTVMGRLQSGIEELELARSYDPISPLVGFPISAHVLFMRRFEEAELGLRSFANEFPEYARVCEEYLAIAIWHQGRHEEAANAFLVYWKETDPDLIAALEKSEAERESTDIIHRIARGLADRASSGTVRPIDPAKYAAIAGDADLCLTWLERAVDQRSPHLAHTLFLPCFDFIRAEPRFLTILRRMDIPKEASERLQQLIESTS